MPCIQKRRWRCTIEYSLGGSLAETHNPFRGVYDQIRYMILADSVTDSMVYGFIFFEKRKTMKALRSISREILWEVAVGSADTHVDWVRSKGPIFEVGSLAPKRRGSGDGLAPCVSDANRPLRARMIEQYSTRWSICKELEEGFRLSCPELAGKILYQWQSDLFDRVELSHPNGSVIWVADVRGSAGKTILARDLGRRGWFYTNCCDSTSLCFQYLERIGTSVVIDVMRSYRGDLPYDFIEAVKILCIPSTKYEPLTVHMDGPVHVIVMSNTFPCCPGLCPKTGAEGHECRLPRCMIELIEIK
jgi:hypothetical protein